MSRSPRSARIRLVCWMAGGAAAAVLLVLSWPVTTRFGVNWEWSSKRLPMYEKAINFISRDLQTRRLASEVTGGASDDEAKLLRAFTWVTEHIRPTPEGFPIVDDHVWNILVRGYGSPDQQAEAFAVLASYAGFPATATCLQTAGMQGGACLTIVQFHGRQAVFDAPHRIVFRNEHGALASIEDLLRQPALITAAAKDHVPAHVPYEPHFVQLANVHLRFSRMENQKPWRRFANELLRLARIVR